MIKLTDKGFMLSQKDKSFVFRAGFTILEVLITTLILAFLIIGITGVLNIGNLAFPIDSASLDLLQQSRQAMEGMTKELREASNIVLTVIDTNSDRLTFNTIDKIGISYYRDLNDVNNDGTVNQVIREYPSGTRKVLANYITRLKFSLTNPILTIQIGADQTVQRKPLFFSLTEQVRLRNE